MGRRNHILGLVFLMAVLGFAVFAAKRLLFRPSPASSRVAALLEKAKPPAKPQPKPSAAVPAQSTAPATVTPPSAAPASSGQAKVPAPPAGETVANNKNEPSPAAKSAVAPTEDHRTKDHLPQLRIESGVRLWIRVTGINRKPDGSFTFRGTLLQPVALANTTRLDQGTELSGSGTVNQGHVTVLVKEFTIAGTDYALQQNDAGGSGERSGTGLAVELDPGKLLEVWLASPSVYRKTP